MRKWMIWYKTKLLMRDIDDKLMINWWETHGKLWGETAEKLWKSYEKLTRDASETDEKLMGNWWETEETHEKQESDEKVMRNWWEAG